MFKLLLVSALCATPGIVDTPQKETLLPAPGEKVEQHHRGFVDVYAVGTLKHEIVNVGDKCGKQRKALVFYVLVKGVKYNLNFEHDYYSWGKAYGLIGERVVVCGELDVYKSRTGCCCLYINVNYLEYDW